MEKEETIPYDRKRSKTLYCFEDLYKKHPLDICAMGKERTINAQLTAHYGESKMEQSEIKTIMDREGYIITHSPRDVTHAICTIHGKIVPVAADDHRCCWIKSLKR